MRLVAPSRRWALLSLFRVSRSPPIPPGDERMAMITGTRRLVPRGGVTRLAFTGTVEAREGI